jgi:hypothetical protein
VSENGRVDFGWIWTDNLRPLLVEIGLLASYPFEESDWIAVDHGLAMTDSEAGPWFDYPVGHIMVGMALEPGAGEMVSVRIDAATDTELAKIRWLSDLMRNWHLSNPPGN